MQWTPAQISVAVGKHGRTRAEDVETGRQTVDAEICEPFAIHTEVSYGSMWTVTHVPTGRAIADASSKKKAQQLVEAIATLTDWTAVTPGACPPEIRDRVIAAARKARRR